MKNLVKLIAAVTLAALSFGAFASTDPNPVKSFVAGSLDVRDVNKTMTVYAEYAGQDDITVALRKRIAALGYTLADSADTADLVFKVTPVYVGKASDRPKAGTYDGVSNRDGINFGKLLIWAAVGLVSHAQPVAGASTVHVTDVAAFWSLASGDSGVTGEVAQAFRPTTKPQEAIVVNVDLIVNGVSQRAEVVSETYAKDVPATVLARENLRQVLWYLE